MKKFLALVAVFALVAFATPVFAAANPFMDVPMNHWAYDAIGQLAARGVLSGYPNGAYKGNQPMTRYEVASAVARALAVVDMTKASKQDVEMLKKLVVEFKDELDALGVKVDQLDSRVALLEEGVGGWKFWGQFRMDAKWADQEGGLYTSSGDTDFNLNRFRVFGQKTIDDNVSFTFRLGKTGDSTVAWERYFVTAKLPWEVTMVVGKYLTDWEGDDKLWHGDENDAMFTDRAMTGFWFTKNFGMGMFQVFAAHFDEDMNASPTKKWLISQGGVLTVPEEKVTHETEGYEYGARFRVNFNETFWLSGNYIKRTYDDSPYFGQRYIRPGIPVEDPNNPGNPNPDMVRTVGTTEDKRVWWAAFGGQFASGWAARVAYYDVDNGGPNNDGNALQGIVTIDQSVMKFTSLWLEYVKVDDDFNVWTAGPWDTYGTVTGKALGNYDDIIFVRADQKWNDQWATFLRYFHGSARGTGALVDDTTNYTFGVKYWYTPAMSFELAYDKIENAQTVRGNDDHVIRLRTLVNF